MKLNNTIFSDLKVSIIVPVYNAEKYLKKCLNSICCQTHENLEIILINDGSTDDSANICKQFQSKDKRIIYIEKENEGQGKARNTGLENMTGKYVSFVDSDDYIDINMIKILLAVAYEYNADMVQCKFLEVDINSEVNFKVVDEINDKQIISRDFVFENIKYERILCNYTDDIISCNKLIRKDLITNMRFPEDIYYEDKHLMFRLRHKANKIIYVNNYLYYYVQSPNSTMRNGIDKKRLKSSFRVSEELLDYCDKNGLIENYNSELAGYFRKLLSIFFQTTNIEEFDEYNQKARQELKKYIPELRSNRYLNKVDKLALYLIELKFNSIYLLFYFNKIRKNFK